MDTGNLIHGKENAYTMLGCISGMIIVYFVDSKWLKFDTKAVWWAQILKCIFGLLAVLAVKEGTRAILNAAFGEFAGRAVRYFLVVLVAGIVWPLTFRYFKRL